MSVPTCKTCINFKKYPFSGMGWGECTDQSKVIYHKSGSTVKPAPETTENCTCRNHSDLTANGLMHSSRAKSGSEDYGAQYDGNPDMCEP